MLISTARRWHELQDAQREARRYRGRVPDTEFYQRKLAAVWERARHTAAHCGLPDFSPEAFAAVPVTSKNELKRAPWDFAAADIADAAKYYESSGTGGTATPTPRLAADVIWNTVSVAEAWSSLLDQGDRVMIMLPSDIVPVADLIASACEYLGLPHVRAYPFTTGMVDWDRLIALWASFRPATVFAAPGVAIQFTRLLRQRGMLAEVADPVETIMLLGEVSTEPLRARLGQWWDARALDASYGSTETGTTATACWAGRQHLISASHYVELAGADGVSALPAQGSGHLVVTPLNLHARPLLRQDTGDWVRIGGHCACGSGCPVIEVSGRSSELVDIHGVSLSARAVEELVYLAEGTTGYLIEVTESGDYARLVLERDLPGQRPGEEQILASLQDAFTERLAVAWDGMVFVNSLSGLTKSGASQKNWKRSNVRVLAARRVMTVTDTVQAGVSSGQADLWCTYAAVRTLTWLGLADQVPDPAGTAAFLRSRLNADGGYAWMKGMPSDAWATYYCTQALRDLRVSPARLDRTSDWLRGTFSGDAYAMMPGQAPDVWATHFSTRTAVELLGEDVPSRAALYRWLAGLQTADGGLTWTPEHAASEVQPAGADLRACHYGITAWQRLARHLPAAPPWDVPRLIGWMRAQQTAGGGFRFGPAATRPCLWATFRGCAALAALGAGPLRREDCVAWISRLRGPAGGFVRWDGYEVQDVWAAFCAVGALRAAGAPVSQLRAGIAAAISGFAVDGGGFTYREPPLAGDALTTAAAVLRGGDGRDLAGLRAWLTGCQLPNEGGIMYMPARGAELRCTLWALAAGALDTQAGRQRAASWLAALQNPDGGFGYWEGRGSDLVSTAAAVEVARLLAGTGDPGQAISLERARRFTASCAVRYPDGTQGHAALPGAEPALRPGLQAARVLAAGQAAVRALLERHRVPGGGYADRGARLPDLLTTYEAVATADRYDVLVDPEPLRAFSDRIAGPDGYRWTPLTPGGGGPLADCLGDLLARRLACPGITLPILVL